jgi:flagellar biosynthesis protein FlhA
VGEGEIWPADLLALQTDEANGPALGGRPTRDPAFGLPATWIDKADERAAIAAGYTVVDPVTVICTHLHKLLKAKAPMLLSPDDVHALVELLSTRQPQLAAAIGAKALPLPVLTGLLQALLEEGLTLRDFHPIAAAIADALSLTQEPADLLELVRERIGPLIAASLLPEGGTLKLIALAPSLEQLVVAAHRAAPKAPWPFEPSLGQRLVERLREAVQPALAAGDPIALVTQPGPRRALWRLLRSQVALPVVAFTELPETLPIEVVAVVGEADTLEAG